MDLFKLTKYLMGLVLVLFVRIRGLVWLLCCGILAVGLVWAVRRCRQQLPVKPVLLWTAAAVGATALLAWRMPPVRLVDLLYF